MSVGEPADAGHAHAAILEQARAWAADDVDPTTSIQLQELIARASADESAMAELADAFRGPLTFGTAGLRGALGPGPARMNRVVVRRAAAGLASYLNERHEHGCAVVIGYDARHESDVFAADTAAILAGAGLRALVLPRALPTPVLAYAIRALGCGAGVMVTASHNPARDNGYKVYLADGSQITPPADEQIAAAIEQASRLPAGSLPMSQSWETLGDDIEQDYVREVVECVVGAGLGLSGAARSAIRLVYTPMHGVGGAVLESVLTAAGFAPAVRVDEQFDPHPDFPTVAFPNPEEAGALDLALALARTRDLQPHAVIANDPDADRCAVAVPDRHGAWRMLSGDELGAILAWWCVTRPRSGDVLAQSLVSCSLLERLAAGAGLRYTRTLTGFKWIGKVAGLRFGYEEALGYCVNPTMVRDKDGIAAALAFAALLAELAEQDRSVLDLLDDIATAYGVFRTTQVSARVDTLARIPEIMAALRARPPAAIGGLPVMRTIDLERGWDDLPATDGLLFDLGGDNRVIVRPSGTEPKVKCYLQVAEPLDGRGLDASRAAADARILALAHDVTGWLNPDR